MDNGVISELKRIVGSSYVITNVYELIPYHLRYGSRPLNKSEMADVAVRPATCHEVSEIIKFANKEEMKVSVISGGTSVTEHKPHKGEVILDLGRMDKVIVNKKDGYAEVGPAVTPVELNDALGKYGYWFPVYPTCSDVVAGIGGIISVNTSGDMCDPMLGKPGDYVTGLEVVLPTGETIETGNESMRRPSGPDLTRLFIGGEGLFGVITKIWMKLVPRPTEEERAVVVFQSLHDAAETVQKVYYQGVYPTWMSIYSGVRAQILFELLGIDFPKGVCLFIRTSGYMPGEAAWKLEKAIETCKKEKTLEIKRIGKAEWQVFTKFFKGNSFFRRGTKKREPRTRKWIEIGGYIDPPLSRYVDVIDEIQEKIRPAVGGKECIFSISAYGPLIYTPAIIISKNGWGRLNSEIKEELKKKQIWRRNWSTYGRCNTGFFPLYTEYWKAHYGPISYQLVKELKRLFDPKNILNPTNISGGG